MHVPSDLPRRRTRRVSRQKRDNWWVGRSLPNSGAHAFESNQNDRFCALGSQVVAQRLDERINLGPMLRIFTRTQRK